MTITEKTTFTFWCDDGRFCAPDGNDFGAQNRASLTLAIRTKREACRKAKALGWLIRHFSESVCPACKRQARIPEWKS